MSDDYLDWEELEQASSAETPSLKEMHAQNSKQRELKELLSIAEVPDELKALVRERMQLESKVKSLTSGNSLNEPEQERENKRFYVPIHTKQTRIKDRKKFKEEEKRSNLRRKRLEEKKITKKRELNRAKEIEKALIGKLLKNKKYAKNIEKRAGQIQQANLGELKRKKCDAKKQLLREEKIKEASKFKSIDKKKSKTREELEVLESIRKRIDIALAKKRNQEKIESYYECRRELNRLISQKLLLQKKSLKEEEEKEFERRNIRAIEKNRDAKYEEKKWLENREKQLARKKLKEY